MLLLYVLVLLFGFLLLYIEIDVLVIICVKLLFLCSSLVIIPSFVGFRFIFTSNYIYIYIYYIYILYIYIYIYVLILLNRGWFIHFHIHWFWWFYSFIFMCKKYHVGFKPEIYWCMYVCITEWVSFTFIIRVLMYYYLFSFYSNYVNKTCITVINAIEKQCGSALTQYAMQMDKTALE